MRTKTEILAKALKDFRETSGETGAGYEKTITKWLKKTLRSVAADSSIRTCEDFADLNVECCPTCHSGIYQHYEIALIDLESGGNAWICCALDRALNPKRRAEYLENPEYKAMDEKLREIFGGGEDATQTESE